MTVVDKVASPSTRARTGIEDIDGWLKALSVTFLIPEGYRTETIDRISAMEILRCDDQVLDTLVRAGLPCAGEPGAELFDAYDLLLVVALGSDVRPDLPAEQRRE